MQTIINQPIIGPVFRPVSAMKDESYSLENWAMAISVQLHLVYINRSTFLLSLL